MIKIKMYCSRNSRLNSRSKILDLKIKFLKFLTIVFTNRLDIGFFWGVGGGWVGGDTNI